MLHSLELRQATPHHTTLCTLPPPLSATCHHLSCATEPQLALKSCAIVSNSDLDSYLEVIRAATPALLCAAAHWSAANDGHNGLFATRMQSPPTTTTTVARCLERAVTAHCEWSGLVYQSIISLPRQTESQLNGRIHICSCTNCCFKYLWLITKANCLEITAYVRIQTAPYIFYDICAIAKNVGTSHKTGLFNST